MVEVPEPDKTLIKRKQLVITKTQLALTWLGITLLARAKIRLDECI